MIRLPLMFCFALAPFSAAALELAMPEGSALVVDQVNEEGSYAVPDSPFLDGFVSTRLVTGHVSKQVWHLPGDALSAEQLVAPLRNQLQAAGYAILLDCDAQSCGGFDFRFSTDVVPAPDMFVDLVNFRFVSALKEASTGTEAISVLASVSDTQGYTQLIAVQPGPSLDALPLSKPSGQTPVVSSVVNPALSGDVIKALDLGGHVVLSDLEFETGSSNLAEGEFASLQVIAGYLAENPSARIALVGHTDSVGSLDNNIALSKKRALAVRERLIGTLGTTSAQIDAQGVGYLAPIASNLTESGRNANRRVEAVLLSK